MPKGRQAFNKPSLHKCKRDINTQAWLPPKLAFLLPSINGSQVVASFSLLLSLMSVVFPWTACPMPHGAENREMMVPSGRQQGRAKRFANMIMPRNDKHRSTRSGSRGAVWKEKRPRSQERCQCLSLIPGHLQAQSTHCRICMCSGPK